MQETSLHHARLFKADTRTAEACDGRRSYTTISEPGITVRDVFMEAAAVSTFSLDQYRQHIFLPIVGTMLIQGAEEIALSSGELACYSGSDTGTVTVQNPFPDETINFLHIGLNEPVDATIDPHISTLSFTSRNSLTEPVSAGYDIRAGVYDSRVTDVAMLRSKGNHLFVYVVNGSFEVEGRLMEYRDGLCLWETGGIEFEALSEAAIILLIEYSPFKIV